jgi:hypothetical protein
MTAATDYLENEVLDHILGEGTRDFVSPPNLYIGLFTAVADGEAGTVTEVAGNAYARTGANFSAAVSGSSANTGDITFPTATGGNWGVLTHAGIYDAATDGNLLFYGALTVTKTVTDGDTFQISDSQLTITLA